MKYIKTNNNTYQIIMYTWVWRGDFTKTYSCLRHQRYTVIATFIAFIKINLNIILKIVIILK